MLSNENIKETMIHKLVNEPLPLYEKDFPIIFFWSPKSGCTSLIKWFFYQIGLLQESYDYDPWIHWYRMDVYEKKDNYAVELTKMLLNGKKDTYKLVRNPYQRAVSAYLATLSNPIIMNEIAPNIKDGLSFKQFLYLIKQIGVTGDLINKHIAQQYIEGEELVIQNYIKLENFYYEIRSMEYKYKLLRSPLLSISKSPHHMSEKLSNQGVFAEAKITIHSTNPFEFKITLKTRTDSLPEYENFYNVETKALVQEIYQKDFAAYGYDEASLI